MWTNYNRKEGLAVSLRWLRWLRLMGLMRWLRWDRGYEGNGGAFGGREPSGLAKQKRLPVLPGGVFG
jgi:hypothetical protein